MLVLMQPQPLLLEHGRQEEDGKREQEKIIISSSLPEKPLQSFGELVVAK